MTDIELTAPQAYEAEQSVLGSILLSESSLASIADFLKPEDFYKRAHGLIYAATLALRDRREPIDNVTLAAELAKSGDLDAAGGRGYLVTLLNAVPTHVHAEHYARIVHGKARLRGLIDVAGRISAIAYEESNDPDQAEQRAMSALLETLTAGTDGVRIYSPADQGDLLIEMLESRERGESSGIPTGLANLDVITGGLQAGELCVLAARPSCGKSSLAECIAQNVAARGHSVAFFSLEMSAKMVLQRFAARVSGKSSRFFISGATNSDDWTALYELAEARSKLPIELVDAPGSSTQTIRSAIDRLALRNGKPVELVVIDYLQLIREPRLRGESDAAMIGRITAGLKTMARQLNVPVLLLAQLNREVEHRGEPEPKLSDLRGSGDIEQDADAVLMLWNDTERDQWGNPYTRMKVAKQRNGPVGDVLVYFDRPRFKFLDGTTER